MLHLGQHTPYILASFHALMDDPPSPNLVPDERIALVCLRLQCSDLVGDVILTLGEIGMFSFSNMYPKQVDFLTASAGVLILPLHLAHSSLPL